MITLHYHPQNWAIFNKYNLELTHNQSSWFGSHPFYMGFTNDNKAYGVLLVNTFPMQLATNSRPSLTFRVMGGNLEFVSESSKINMLSLTYHLNLELLPWPHPKRCSQSTVSAHRWPI